MNYQSAWIDFPILAAIVSRPILLWILHASPPTSLVHTGSTRCKLLACRQYQCMHIAEYGQAVADCGIADRHTAIRRNHLSHAAHALRERLLQRHCPRPLARRGSIPDITASANGINRRQKLHQDLQRHVATGKQQPRFRVCTVDLASGRQRCENSYHHYDDHPAATAVIKINVMAPAPATGIKPANFARPIGCSGN